MLPQTEEFGVRIREQDKNRKRKKYILDFEDLGLPNLVVEDSEKQCK